MYFSENYKNKKLEIDFIDANKYLIFKIPNFLDKENYEILKNNFPKIDETDFKDFDIKKSNFKYRIMSKHENYEAIINSNQVLKDFHTEIFSKNFFSYIYNNLKKKILLSRMNDLRYFIKLLLPKSIDKKNSRFITNIHRQIEFSYIFNGGRIVPHTDARSKLISLMLYFPEFDEENKLSNDEKKLGTVFWKSEQKSIENNHLSIDKDEKFFKSQGKKIYITPFEKYHLYGFIRNENSWHSVEEIDIDKNYIRKSININFTCK